MKRRHWIITLGWIVTWASLITGVGAAPLPPGEVGVLVAPALPEPWTVQHASLDAAGVATVCLAGPTATLAAGEGLEVERLHVAVRRALTPLDWRELHVQAMDGVTGLCLPLSDFLPRGAERVLEAVSAPLPAARPAALTEFPHSLAGKTVYLSAGHGWQWNGWAWRTQRSVQEGFIEDHNNAEAVNQFLIPYLENAGATVIPVRERDWNPARVIADNDAGAPVYIETGAWTTGGAIGYAGGTYRFASTVSGTANASAQWVLTAPQTGRYALYAWVYPGSNRAPDAQYTVQHAGGSTTVVLDQRLRQSTWRYLGEFPCYAGPVTVTLSNLTAATGSVVIADALRLGGGVFGDLGGIVTDAPAPPDKPWWETATFYYSQWMGLSYADWPNFNDVVSRPIFARWNHAGSGEDAIFISWHTNAYNGAIRGTESYVHNGDTYPRTEGSLALQTAIHAELLQDIRQGWNAGWIDRGKRTANFGELRLLWDDAPATRMPGVLLEIAFHDEPEDADALKDPRFNQLAARAVYQGVVAYFAGRDGVALTLAPEPPTHLRVRNLGAGQVQVAWAPSPTDAVGLRGDAATGYRLYTSPDGFAWSAPFPVTGLSHTLTGLAPGQLLFVRVTATNAGGESFPTEVLGARVGTPRLLLVYGFDRLDHQHLVRDNDPVEGLNLRLWLDRMNRRDYVVHHGAATPAEYAWDSASNEAVAAGLISLTDYALVNWILGQQTDTLSAVERNALADYLAAERALLISGSELAWDLEGRDPAFLREVLRTGYVANDAGTASVVAAPGGAFAALGAFTFAAPGEYVVAAPDVLTPQPGATVSLNYVGGSGGAAAIQYANGCRRMLVVGFPLEVVPLEARPAVLAHALTFLDACAPLELAIVTPRDGSYFNAPPAFTGTVQGGEVTHVDVQVQRASDAAVWDGAAWLSSPTWLSATGTTAWSYALPSLGEDVYTLRARAVGVVSTTTPAQVSFMLDATPPLTPTLITPTGGITLTQLKVGLQWSPPEDVGSPLAYHVVLDGVIWGVAGTQYTVTALSGAHYWLVRAVDAAGNIGPWSATETFTVVLQHVYLPLVLKAD